MCKRHFFKRQNKSEREREREINHYIDHFSNVNTHIFIQSHHENAAKTKAIHVWPNLKRTFATWKKKTLKPTSLRNETRNRKFSSNKN